MCTALQGVIQDMYGAMVNQFAFGLFRAGRIRHGVVWMCEYKKILCFALVVLCAVGPFASCGFYESKQRTIRDRAQAVSEMVKAGVDPVAAVCAIDGEC